MYAVNKASLHGVDPAYVQLLQKMSIRAQKEVASKSNILDAPRKLFSDLLPLDKTQTCSIAVEYTKTIWRERRANIADRADCKEVSTCWVRKELKEGSPQGSCFRQDGVQQDGICVPAARLTCDCSNRLQSCHCGVGVAGSSPSKQCHQHCWPAKGQYQHSPEAAKDCR